MKTHYLFSFAAVLTVVSVLVGCEDQGPVLPGQQQTGEGAIHPLERQSQPLVNAMEELDRIASSADRGVSHWLEGGAYVELPAGSVDGLADAISAAGDGGVVLVLSGMHTESNTVTITNAVRVVGEEGAVMQFATNPYTAYPGALDPALHVLGATGRVVLWGLEIIPEGDIGGVAVLIENSSNAVVGRNTIRDHQNSIYVQYGDNAKIYGNTIETTTAWQTGDVPDAGGIIIANGENAGMWKNDVAYALFGVWPCGTGGLYARNNTHDGLIGLIFCKVPDSTYVLPSGEFAASEVSSNYYLATLNNSTGNLANGYLVIDGANHNVLIANRASNNGTYDIELAGDSLSLRISDTGLL